MAQAGSGEITLGGHADRGLTLAALYDTGVLERLRLEVRVRILIDLTESLSWLHANPRLMAAHPHLWIAPSSIVIGLDGVARVDVRAAKKGSSDRGELEAGYRAPELAQGGSAADHRADIFSVGVLAWEAITGARLATDPPRPTHLPLGTGAEWALPCAELARDATNPDPARRPADCQALLGRLATLDPARLATHQEIAEAVQGITALSTLCVPAPTLPSADATCQGGPSPARGTFTCATEAQTAPVCHQAPRVEPLSPPAPEPASEAPRAEPEPRPLETTARLPAASTPLRQLGGGHSARTWFAVGLLWLAVIGTITGYVASLLAR